MDIKSEIKRELTQPTEQNFLKDLGWSEWQMKRDEDKDTLSRKHITKWL